MCPAGEPRGAAAAGWGLVQASCGIWLIFGDDGFAGHHGDVIGLVVGLSFVEHVDYFLYF